MTGLKRYTVDTPAGEITVQLSDREAEERGLKKAAAKKTATAQGGKSTAAKRAEVSGQVIRSRRGEEETVEPPRGLGKPFARRAARGEPSLGVRAGGGLGRGAWRRIGGHWVNAGGEPPG